MDTANWILLIGVGAFCASVGLVIGFFLGSRRMTKLMRFDNGLLKELISTYIDFEKGMKRGVT